MTSRKAKSGYVRGLARNFFSKLYEMGLSANKALSWLRERGLGYRRQDFLKDYRNGKSNWEQASRVRFLNLDKTPNESTLAPEYHGVPDKYSFVFHYTRQGDEEGSEVESYFYWHTNEIITRREMEQKALDYLVENEDKYRSIIQNPALRFGYINPVYA